MDLLSSKDSVFFAETFAPLFSDTNSLREHKIVLEEERLQLAKEIAVLSEELRKLNVTKKIILQKRNGMHHTVGDERSMSEEVIEDKKQSIREKLIEKKEKEKETQSKKKINGEIEENVTNCTALNDFVERNNSIATVRKENVFVDGVTVDEQKIIDQRVKLQQKQFEFFEQREKQQKYSWIKRMHPYITMDEALAALDLCSGDEDEAALKLAKYGFLLETRKQVATNKVKNNFQGINGAPSTSNLNIPVGQASPSKRDVKLRNPKKKMNNKIILLNRNSVKKLKLDDALKVKDELNTYEGWSNARIRAYKLIDKNPNAYYYRFNAPGDIQKNGKWTKEEQTLFYKRMEEVGVSGKWGIFSMVIPGRVGYQCSNFYRHLIETGKMQDPNYEIDASGKAHYKFNSKKKSDGDSPSPSMTDTSATSTSAARNTKKSKRKKGKRTTCSDYSDDDDYQPSKYKRKNKGEDEAAMMEYSQADNPLGDFIDSITLEQVERPAISPYGHVLGKATWSMCLSNENARNVCPFTKQTLHKRDLVLLSWDNIEQYRDKIVNWPK